MNAIVMRSVAKRFKKQLMRREHTTVKDVVVRFFKRKKDPLAAQPSAFIEALRCIDLEIPQGKTIGIIGRNGSGKSTLLKIMTGIYTPSSGTVEVTGRISALLELGAGFHPDFTGRENVLINGVILGMKRAEVKARMDAIIQFAELGDFIDEPVRTYSSGMYMRLAFAVATHVDPEILIIDEILSVGDEHFSRKSLAKMNEFKRCGKTIVLVTHDLATVQRWCDLAAWIDGGQVRLVADPRTVVEQYRQAVSAAEALAEQGALSQPGAALPAVPAPPRQAPPPPAVPRRFQLELGAVQVRSLGENPPSGADLNGALEISFEFSAHEPLGDVVFSVSLLRADGLEVYGTSTAFDRVGLPTPLSGRGRLSLCFERPGLPGGEYRLDLTAHCRGGQLIDAHRALPFTVRAAPQLQVAPRLPHRWRFELLETKVTAPTARQVQAG